MSKEKFDRSKPHVNIGTIGDGEDTTIAKESSPEVINLSEKMEEVRAVQAEEDIKSIYGDDKVKPFSEDQVSILSSWGSKKRIRFAEIMDMGKDTLQAFDIVENHKGVIID